VKNPSFSSQSKNMTGDWRSNWTSCQGADGFFGFVCSRFLFVLLVLQRWLLLGTMARVLAALFIVFIVVCGAIAQDDPSYPFQRLKISLEDPQTQLGQLVEEHPELIVEHVGKDYAEVKLLKTDFEQFKKRSVLNYEEVVRSFFFFFFLRPKKPRPSWIHYKVGNLNGVV
jgi:hypothetical protein